ncbi:MAG: IclR family transcriptional regulator [Anaerolineae bacterium]|nr:IclR family transcriptional regulator [Anaerolineae bacterium]
MSTRDDYLVKPVHKALQVLMCFQNGEELGLTEIRHRVDIPKTTIYRYLFTFCESGFLEHDLQTDRYRIGSIIINFATGVDALHQIRSVALPYMQRLRDQFGETVNLGILDGYEVVYIAMVESPYSLRMQAKVDARDSLYSTALGKSLLVFLPDNEIAFHLPSEMILKTKRTITSLDALREDLSKVRLRGYSIDDEENEVGAYCVGAPILNDQQDILAAVSISGPISRMSSWGISDISKSLIKAASMISDELRRKSSRTPL